VISPVGGDHVFERTAAFTFIHQDPALLRLLIIQRASRHRQRCRPPRRHLHAKSRPARGRRQKNDNSPTLKLQPSLLRSASAIIEGTAR